MLESVVQEIDAFYESSTFVHIKKKDLQHFLGKRIKTSFVSKGHIAAINLNIYDHCTNRIDLHLSGRSNITEVKLECDNYVQCQKEGKNIIYLIKSVFEKRTDFKFKCFLIL